MGRMMGMLGLNGAALQNQIIDEVFQELTSGKKKQENKVDGQITIYEVIAKEALMKKKVYELRTIAALYEIKGHWEMSKEELVEQILERRRGEQK